jgi:thiaminase
MTGQSYPFLLAAAVQTAAHTAPPAAHPHTPSPARPPVHTELRLHDSYARSWDVDLDAIGAIHPATRAYTDFLMDVSEDPEVGGGVGGGGLRGFRS